MATKSGGGRIYVTGITAGMLLVWAGAAHAQTQLNTSISQPQTAHLIEWDLPAADVDANPGAMVVDTRGEDHNRLWFVTRFGAQRVYRFDLPESLTRGNAQWSSWDLHPDGFAGGIRKIKPSHDRMTVFVHMPGLTDLPDAPSIQQVDTRCNATTKYSTPSPCQRIVWTFQGDVSSIFVSDLGVDDNNHVFSTGSNNPSYPGGYVQMLDPAQANSSTPVAKRWGFAASGSTTQLGALNGAGQCPDTQVSFVCNAGIDVHPTNQRLVYFTEQGAGGSITELNTALNADPSNPYPPMNIRRWLLTDLVKASCATYQGCEPVTEPRTLKIDSSGKVWITTGTGHIVSLDPQSSLMTKHLVPGAGGNDLWGLAPDDDVIGYTAAQTSKVAMLLPKFKAVKVGAKAGFAASFNNPATVLRENETPDSGTAPGIPKIAQTTTTRNADGTYVEALVGTAVPACSSVPATPSFSPLGITPNKAKGQGTFFYTVGIESDPTNGSFAKRVGYARLPIKEKIKRPRDDDDTDDGFDTTTCPAFHNAEPGDRDADGVPDQYDTPSSKDNMTMGDPASLSAGQSVDYPLTASMTSLALIASATADSATAQIAVEIYNSLGALVATSAPTPGGAVATLLTPPAGKYTARVRNMGVASFNHTPTLVVREPAVP